MTDRNDITGDKIATKVPSKQYKDNWDAVFGKPEKPKGRKEDGR